MSRRAYRRVLFIALALLVVFLLTGGRETLRTVRFGLEAYLRPGPDYERLELDRATQATAAADASSRDDGIDKRAATAPPYWVDLRGPGRLSVYDERPIALDWPPAGPPRLWRQPIGPGYGSFTVAEGLAFTLEQRREREAVVAYDVLTGREVWVHAYPARFDEVFSGEGPRATPVYADGAVYSLGATGELFCLGASDGTVRWRRDVLLDSNARALLYGFAATPLVYGELLIVCGAEPEPSGSAVLAYDRASGEPVWGALKETMAYASPVVLPIAGRPQLVVFTATRVVALDPADGKELWDYAFGVSGGLACAQPVLVDASHLLVSGGYGKGAELIRVQPTDGGYVAEHVWSNARLKNRYSSSVLHEGRVYGLDEGRLVCIEPLTGERLWKGDSYGHGQIVLVQGHLILTGEEGDLALVEATPAEFRERARFQAIEGMTLNLPALADGLLLIRNHDEMACFDLRPAR